MYEPRVKGVGDVIQTYVIDDSSTCDSFGVTDLLLTVQRSQFIVGVNDSESSLSTMPFNSLTHIVSTSIVVSAIMLVIILCSVFFSSRWVVDIMLVIILGNVLVVVAVGRDRSLAGPQNWFIASLAVSDILVGLFIMPLSLANELMGYWVFGGLLCELWLSTDVLLCTASILNLVLISLDRYWSITRAVEYSRFRTRPRAAAMITVVWTLSAVVCFPPLVGWKQPQPKPKDGLAQCILSQELGYIVYSTVGSFYIPLVVMIGVYLKIFHVTRSRARRSLRSNLTLTTRMPSGEQALNDKPASTKAGR